MGLDVHVMPIWKFKAGDFASPLERLGMVPVIARPDGMTERDPHSRPGLITRWRAKRSTQRLKREIEAEIGHPVHWNDKGDVAYTERAYYGFVPLRAFAKWLDYRDIFPTFEAPPEDDYYKHPVMSDKLSRPTTYPQVVDHCCYCGYYLPAEVERVVYVEPFSTWGGFVFKHSVGASNRLLKELQQLSGVLGVDDQYDWEEGDPLVEVKMAFAQLYKVAKISCEQNLPVIFDG